MTLDPTLVQAWNAYPRYIYHDRRGFVARDSGRPFKAPVRQAAAAGPGAPSGGLGYEDELQFAAAARRGFPFLLIEPGIFARLNGPHYSIERLAVLIGVAFGQKVHATTLLAWLHKRPEYLGRGEAKAAQAPRPRGRPRKAAPAPHRSPSGKAAPQAQTSLAEPANVEPVPPPIDGEPLPAAGLSDGAEGPRKRETQSPRRLTPPTPDAVPPLCVYCPDDPGAAVNAHEGDENEWGGDPGAPPVPYPPPVDDPRFAPYYQARRAFPNVPEGYRLPEGTQVPPHELRYEPQWWYIEDHYYYDQYRQEKRWPRCHDELGPTRRMELEGAIRVAKARLCRGFRFRRPNAETPP